MKEREREEKKKVNILNTCGCIDMTTVEMCVWTHPCLIVRWPVKVAAALCELNRGLIRVAITSHA